MDWLSLFLLVLIISITYIYAIQGLVSASIMCGLVLLCAAFSFATYEWIAFSFLLGPLGDLSVPAAFMGAFVIPLIALRLGMDAWITRANLIPSLIDRGGAAAVGLVTAFLMTGMLALSIHMLPFGGSFLGHTSMDAESGEVQGLWLSPDRFAAKYASLMSNGLLSSGRSFSDVHPDFVEEVVWSQSSAKEVRHIAPPGSIRVLRVENRDYIFDKTPGVPARRRTPGKDPVYDRVKPAAGRRFYLVRVALGPDARDDEKQHRFGRRQVRLVGRDAPGARAANYTPVAVSDNERPNMAVRIADRKLYVPDADGEIDFVFDVPESFSPEFIEYMVGARADLHGIVPESSFEPMDAPARADAGASEASSQTSARPSTRKKKRGPGGRVSGVRVTTRTRFGDALPMPMVSYEKSGFEESRGALVSGHIYGYIDEQAENGSQRRLTRFDVPPDKRLFHLEVEQLRARSTFGRALSFAVTTVKNYRLTDRRGNIYQVIGQYVVADIDGRGVIEVQYYPEDVAASGRGGIREFRRVKKRQLDARGTQLVYLFLVDPGVQLVEFSTGRRGTDLSDLDLVAPD